MSKHEFDEWLLKKLQEEELEYHPEHWQQLAQKLPPAASTRKKLFVKWQAIAAGIAGVLLVVAGWTLFSPSRQQDIPDKIATSTQPETPIPDTGEEDPSAASPTPAAALNDPIKNKEQLTAGHTPYRQAVDNQTETPDAVAQQTRATALPAGADRQEQQEQIAHKEAEQQSPFPKGRENYSQVVPEPFIAHRPKQTILSVGGGVNYGSVNTGYAVGVSARRNLGNNFFLDGTVAMMYNDNATQIADYNNKAVQFASRPLDAANTISTPAMAPASNRLYYLQFNPTFGYQIDEDIALSVGGDVQQMLNAQPGELKVSTADPLAKILPAMDIGLTAKSEFTIAPNVQAGVLYREGLNNVLRASNQYFNRRYFQVQFKYNIPIK